ncbi:unnamed protein product [Urochloa humidicola]
MALFAVLPASPVAAASPSFSYMSGRGYGASALRVTATSKRRVSSRAARSVSIRCEQSAKQGSGADVWLGRAAMVGFASAISVEVATGKGFLQNFGVATPAPTLALAVSGLVVFFLLQSGGSRD